MYVYTSTRDVPVTSRGHEADFSDGSAFQSFFGRRLYSRLLWLGPPERSHPAVSGLSTPGRGRNEEGVERPFPAVSSRLTGALPGGPPPRLQELGLLQAAASFQTSQTRLVVLFIST